MKKEFVFINFIWKKTFKNFQSAIVKCYRGGTRALQANGCIEVSRFHFKIFRKILFDKSDVVYSETM